MLQKTISALRPATWEEINRVLLSSARQAKLEDGAVVRLDSTVTSALMHEPSDNSLLWDAVRVMVRLLKRADVLIGGTSMAWRDHCRAAKRRARKIQFTRGRPNRVQLYRELIEITRATLAYLEQASERLAVASTPSIALWQIQVRHYRPLVERIIRQSERRVLAGEPVPAGEKLVSLFEEHADIIVKGSRDTEYGHKLNLTTGRSGMILDLMIEKGNPADSDRLLPMLLRPLWSGAAAGGRRRWLRHSRQSGHGESVGRLRHGLPQESWPQHRGHGQKQMGLSQAAQLPCGHRGRHLMPQACLRFGALHLARPRSLQDLRLVLGRGLQPRHLHPPQADLN